MSATVAAPTAGYRHEAVLYSGLNGFLACVTPFVRDGVVAGVPVLVVVGAAKIAALRAELGAAADLVSFADMDDVGRNPATIIAAWREFVAEHAAAGATTARGVGEPVHAGRDEAALTECQRHEALLNLAFEPSVGLWLICPYDVSELAAPVIDAARRTHPYVGTAADAGVAAHPSGGPDPAYVPPDPATVLAEPLPPAPAAAAWIPFGHDGLRAVRALTAQRCAQFGLDDERAADLVMAVNELAVNSVEHAGGRGVLRIWTEGDRMVCEVTDRGHITEPLIGRLPPSAVASSGRGLWLANHVCDLVQIESVPDLTRVRLHMRAPAAV